ncbi:MAG: amino acid kinase [Methanolobus sp.]|nr:amino acid kinase [Methanolobus sp.]
MRAVVKIGGSLLKRSPSIIRTLQYYLGGDDSEYSILIVPGGGMFADSIRKICEKYSVGDDAAHWMAVLSMEQYAYYMIDKTGAKSVETFADVSGVSVLLPYRILKDSDTLAHSWKVTADTIAAWVAKETGSRFIKVTDVDGIIADDIVQERMTAEELSKMEVTCVDSSMPVFLMENKMDCIVVNGRYPERVIDAVIGENVVGTYIKGNI